MANQNKNYNFPPLNGSKRPRTESPPPILPTFDRFYQIRLLTGSFKDISPFLIYKSLDSYFGTLSDIKKLSDGSLLIEVKNESQAQLADKLTKLNNYEVATSIHPNLNVIKGVITCFDLSNCSDEEILENLNDQGVVKVYRLPPSKKNPSRPSATFILSFKTHSLPSSIKAGWYNIRVRKYIPNPLRCFKCQRFGHHAAKCSFTQLCPSCGHDSHGEVPCSKPPTCINCKNNHSPRYKGCPSFQQEFQIQKIRVEDKISYPDAKRKFISLNPSIKNSYSSAVSKGKTTFSSIAIQCDIPQIILPSSSFTSQTTLPTIPLSLPSCHYSSFSTPSQLTTFKPPSTSTQSSSPPIRKVDLSNIKTNKPNLNSQQNLKSDSQNTTKTRDNSFLSKSTTNKTTHKSNKDTGKSSKSSKESLSDNMSIESPNNLDPNKSTPKGSRKKY